MHHIQLLNNNFAEFESSGWTNNPIYNVDATITLDLVCIIFGKVCPY